MSKVDLPVAAGVPGVDDGRDLPQCGDDRWVVVDAGAIDHDQVGLGRADGFEVGLRDAAERRHLASKFGEVVRHCRLAAAGDRTDRCDPEGEQAVKGRLREGHHALRVLGHGDLGACDVDDDAGGASGRRA